MVFNNIVYDILKYQLIQRTIKKIKNVNLTEVNMGIFACCADLTTISFPNVTNIGTYAFYSCRSLTTASFSNKRLSLAIW